MPAPQSHLTPLNSNWHLCMPDIIIALVWFYRVTASFPCIPYNSPSIFLSTPEGPQG
eukprot:c45784_g1_i1 orf=105-275(+)